MEGFCFVILHYQTLSDTISCVHSILSNIKSNNYRIVIVDNGSPNKSGINLKEKFEGDPVVNVILSNKNLGFTSGNNLGITFAKKTYNPKFIALINNDTLIEQAGFIDIVEKKFNEHHFDILGPDIITPEGKHQSPTLNKMTGLTAVERYLRFYRKILFLNYLGLDKIAENTKKSFFPVSRLHLENIHQKREWDKEQENVMLHGSALIFSSNYIETYNGLYPGPFMYGEEAILDFIAKRDKLKVIYCPDIRIKHIDDSATNSVFKRSLRKRRFYIKNFLRSTLVLKDLMKNYPNK